mmetsp:Transcript_5249/g.16865  ORF Transcript_5249/g.16865 Transcript_5249/m.16865 type:complete len:257 (+) Transcript_5249:3257-4027(+)
MSIIAEVETSESATTSLYPRKGVRSATTLPVRALDTDRAVVPPPAAGASPYSAASSSSIMPISSSSAPADAAAAAVAAASAAESPAPAVVDVAPAPSRRRRLAAPPDSSSSLTDTSSSSRRTATAAASRAARAALRAFDSSSDSSRRRRSTESPTQEPMKMLDESMTDSVAAGTVVPSLCAVSPRTRSPPAVRSSIQMSDPSLDPTHSRSNRSQPVLGASTFATNGASITCEIRVTSVCTRKASLKERANRTCCDR